MVHNTMRVMDKFYTLDGRDKITAANIEYDDYDDSYDDYYDQNKNDRMRGRDAKRREKKEIDDALGKDRAGREAETKDLHDSKRGDRNDHNKSFGDLKNHNYWEYSHDFSTENAVGAGAVVTMIIFALGALAALA